VIARLESQRLANCHSTTGISCGWQACSTRSSNGLLCIHLEMHSRKVGMRRGCPSVRCGQRSPTGERRDHRSPTAALPSRGRIRAVRAGTSACSTGRFGMCCASTYGRHLTALSQARRPLRLHRRPRRARNIVIASACAVNATDRCRTTAVAARARAVHNLRQRLRAIDLTHGRDRPAPRLLEELQEFARPKDLADLRHSADSTTRLTVPPKIASRNQHECDEADHG
jgi:hypothetical protein